MKKQSKIMVLSGLLPFTAVCAYGSSSFDAALTDPLSAPTTQVFQSFRFDSSALLHFQKEKKPSQQTPEGFFLYKHHNPLNAGWLLPTLPDGSELTNHSLYGRVLSRLMQHVFIDLAGGYTQSYEPNTPWVRLNPLAYQESSSKNWFASASALFTHTWKELAFNANLGLLHTPQDLFAYTGSVNPLASSLRMNDLHNNTSFLQENAELSYRMNAQIQPFVSGGLLQPLGFSGISHTLPTAPSDFTAADANVYKLGGGVALNYKQCVLRLEQNYVQQGALRRANQSSLSLKVNLG